MLRLAAVVVEAIIGTASYVIAAIVSGDYGSINLSGVLKSAFWGAVSGAVTFGIGSCFTVAATGANTAFASSLQSAKFLVQAGMHAVAQGTLAMVQSGGAGFFSGASAGFFGSMGATAWSAGVGGKFASSGVGTIAFGALSGGVGAELAGGNFWQGAVTGGIVAGLNHELHKRHDPRPKSKINYKKYFSSLLNQSLTGMTTDLAAFSITGQYRHLFGPDAIAVSGNANAGVGGVVKLEKGALFVLNGSDANQIYAYDDFGVGATLASASANVSSTKLYYSGSNNFKHDVFLGQRYELNFGIDVGIGLGATGIYAPLSNGKFVIGFGVSAGVGVSVTAVDVNLNYGTTSRTFPWRN